MALSNGPNLGLLVNGADGEEHYLDLMKAWRGLDGLVMPHVQSRTLATPPTNIVDGQTYIIPANATGAWAGRTNRIARGFTVGTNAPGWEYYVPKKGWSVMVEDEGDINGVPLEYRYDGTHWAKPDLGPTREEVLLNPMTTVGDIIIAGDDGSPIRLPAGGNKQVLTSEDGVPKWKDPEVSGGGGGSGMTNPMAAEGDLIVGGASGVAQRLGVGTAGQVLKVVDGIPQWGNESGGGGGGMDNPMTTAGDIIVADAGGVPMRLGKGGDGQVLKMVAGLLAWANEVVGMINPMTTPSDLIVGGIDGAPTRLPKGADNQVLKIISGALQWAEDAGGMTNPMSALGDLIIGGTSGAPARLAPGSAGQVLKMVSGQPAWAAESGGGGGGPASTDELVEGVTNLYFTAARVRAVVMTGLSITTNSIVLTTDTLLVAIGKLQAQVNARVQTSALGVTVAQLVNGTVPASQLPSYVDDVLEYANAAAFPATGETGKIYIDLATNEQYRWSGSAYVKLVASPGTTSNVPEGTNLYFTAARVLAVVLTGFVAGSNTAVAATDTVLQALQKLQGQVAARLPLAGGQMTGAVLQAPPVSVASAATTNIAVSTAETINITGTTTITAFSTAPAGVRKRLVFGGVLTLTHGPSSLILPGYANITTTVGDVAEMESLGGGNWKCVSYTKVNGRQVALGAVVPTLTAANETNIYAPGVDVVKVSGTTGVGYLGSGADGQEVTVIFTGATPLYASTSLILPGGVNLTTTAGDIARFVYEGAGVTRLVSYMRAAVSGSTAPLLGTVSQSGGVPTGAIIERGSNANGEYIRFADGTQICTMSITVTDQAIDTPYSTLYQGVRAWAFPQTFSSPPAVSCANFKWGSSAGWSALASNPTVSSVILRGFDVNARAAGTSTQITAFAIGRWY